MLDAGDPAPDFDLPGTDGDRLGVYRLSNALRHGPAVLAFYPFDFHPASTETLRAIGEFDWASVGEAVAAFGVGPDSAFSHRAYRRAEDLDLPLLSDGSRYVIEQYGVPLGRVRDHGAVPSRAAVVVGPDATVRYAWVAEDESASLPLAELAEALPGRD